MAGKWHRVVHNIIIVAKSGRKVGSKVWFYEFYVFFEKFSEINAQPKIFSKELLKCFENAPKDFSLDLLKCVIFLVKHKILNQWKFENLLLNNKHLIKQCVFISAVITTNKTTLFTF